MSMLAYMCGMCVECAWVVCVCVCEVCTECVCVHTRVSVWVSCECMSEVCMHTCTSEYICICN